MSTAFSVGEKGAQSFGQGGTLSGRDLGIGSCLQQVLKYIDLGDLTAGFEFCTAVKQTLSVDFFVWIPVLVIAGLHPQQCQNHVGIFILLQTGDDRQCQIRTGTVEPLIVL